MSENTSSSYPPHPGTRPGSTDTGTRPPWAIRPYAPQDESSWLRCRVLAFLDTCYYDDVWTTRPAAPAIQLVASMPGDSGNGHEDIAGILDIELDGELATIDTIAVHPDHRREGIADALLGEGLRRLPSRISTLDAWTREDAPAHAWYRADGFGESDHYLHVYKGRDDPADGWEAPQPLWRPVMAFCHADLADEDEIRSRFARVYVCRRFSRAVGHDAPTLEG
jgi:ribosomal protein S18 acetylase RimI-like enzyme